MADRIELADPGRVVDQKLLDEVSGVLRSGKYILGEKTEEFERKFSGFVGTGNAVAVSSGTCALQLALLACGVGPGDEVITTPFTFIATGNSILHVGARPVFVDIDPGTFNMDPSGIKGKVTEKTRAILPVHIYGNPCDMDPIMEIAERHNLKVIEDACQAHGAKYRDRPVGSIGDAGCFSFYPSKVMTVMGDGGMVTSNNREIAESVEMLRNQGRGRGEKYLHQAVGFNYRMSELSAAIGIRELELLPEWIRKRRGIARMYSRLLNGGRVKIPVEREWAYAVYYVYTIRVKERDKLRERLEKEGIGTGIYYPVPLHMQPAYKGLGISGGFPQTEKASGEILSIPMHPHLTGEEVRRAAEAVNREG